MKTVTATIKKIHPLKQSRFEYYFQRVEFKLESGEWAKTDLVQAYRNYARWKPILMYGEGTVVSNLQMKSKSEVNADSYPKIVNKPTGEEANRFAPAMEEVGDRGAIRQLPPKQWQEMGKKLGAKNV